MRRLLFILIILLCPSLVFGHNTRDYVIKFDVSDFLFKQEGNYTHIISRRHDTYLKEDTLLPALPYTTVRVLIPSDCSFVDYQCDIDESYITELILSSNPKASPTNNSLGGIHNTQCNYDKEQTYPFARISYAGASGVYGFRYVSFSVSPFRYDAMTHKLYLATTMRFRLSLKKTDGRELQGSTPPSYFQQRNYRNYIQSIIVNANEMDVFYPVESSYLSKFKSRTNDDVDYLIITSYALSSSFNKLLKWKRQKGIRTKILTVENIYANYSGSTNQLKIKEAIKYYVDNKNTNFVLLGGDNNVVPVQYCHMILGGRSRQIPVDYYYCCFNQMSWPAEVTDLIMSNDTNVLDSNVALSRLPASNSTQVDNFVNRVIAYEKGTNCSSWNNNLLMSGCQVSSDTLTWMNMNTSDVKFKGNIIYNSYIQPYWSGTKVELFDSTFTHDNIHAALSSGYKFVNVDTHGDSLCWYTYDGTYSSYSAVNLNNPRPTIITTTACHTNWFDSYTDCLSKSFLCSANTNVLAYWGCSREGWYSYPVYILGMSQEFVAQFYHKLFNAPVPKSFGIIHNTVRNNFLHPIPSDYYKWLLLGMNAMGDPEMPIFVNSPSNALNPSATFIDGTLSIHSNLTGCRVCVMSSNDNGVSYYDVLEDTGNNTVDFTFYPTYPTCKICVTKQGYVPVILTLTNNTYIQNETFTGYNTISKPGHTFIGKDVTTSKPQGPVIIQSGSLTISKPTDVNIKNDFEVKQGAVFKINFN